MFNSWIIRELECRTRFRYQNRNFYPKAYSNLTGHKTQDVFFYFLFYCIFLSAPHTAQNTLIKDIYKMQEQVKNKNNDY